MTKDQENLMTSIYLMIPLNKDQGVRTLERSLTTKELK